MSEQTADKDYSIEEVKLPVKRVEGETLEDTLTGNAYHNILPARYLQKDEEGDLVEDPEGLFKRVARNVALADAVYQAEDAGYELTATPADIKPDASQNRRRDLCDEIFGPEVGLSSDDTVRVTEDNIYAFSYDTIVPKLPEELQERVQATYEEFHDDMTSLSFMPNSPTLMNAGDDFQQLSACFVDSPEDDIDNIHETAKEAAKIFQCLTEESTVVEQDKGIISVSEIEEGDMILQSSEEEFQYKTVKETHKYENSPTITLNLENGLEIRGTPNHELLVNGRWTRLDEVSESDEVHYSLGWIEELESSSPVLETVSEGPKWSRKVSNKEIFELYQNGLSDYEIAERLDVGKSTVQRRRADEMQLPPNSDTGRTSGHTTFDEQEAVKMYEDGMTDGQIADELGISKPTVQQFRNANSMSPNGNPVKEVTQPQHLTTQVAELVGLWSGDGSYHSDGVRFHISKEETVKWLEETVQDVFDTSVSKTYSDGCYTVTINSREIKRFWKKNFDVKSDGSQEVTVPSVISKATPAEIKAYIRGYASADGSLQHNNYPVIYSSSEECINQIATLMMGLGMPVRKSCIRDSDENPYYSIRPTTEHGRELFRAEIGFVDDREVRPVNNPRDTDYNENSDWTVSVNDVEVDKNADVYDITVEDNHQYITDGIVSHNSGGGMGYAFSRLRPYGDRVGSTGGIASGPISFMRTYDQMCGTIAQGGKRRGAQMGILRVDHPDIIQFIHAKDKDVSLTHSLKLNDPDDFTHNSFGEALEEARELIEYDEDGIGRVPEHLRNAAEGHLSNFNISVGVTSDFMEAVKNDEQYTLINPRTDEPYIANQETKDLYSWFGLGDEVEVGEPLEVPAREIFERITEGAWENGEPGMVFLDRANEKHSFNTEEYPEHEILATNPCGEQPLEEYEACNLGHINLSTIVDKETPDWRAFEKTGDLEEDVRQFLEESVDWERLDGRIERGTHFLENVVTMSDFPVDEIVEKVGNNRKVGLGIMGLAQMYIQMGVKYGSETGDEVARQIMKHINHKSKEVSRRMATGEDTYAERGSFSNWHKSKYADPESYPEWFELMTGEDAEDWSDGYPIRNHNTTTIAPTGTTSMIGDTTGGCEPIYQVAFYKNVTQDVQGDEMLVEFDDYFLRTLEENDIDVESVKREAQEQMQNNEFEGVYSLDAVPNEVGELFVTTGELDAEQHISVQCALQEGVDSAISKTVNAPSDATPEDTRRAFMEAYEQGGKGITYYRDGTRSKQVVTTRADNQATDEEEAVEQVREQIEEGEIDVEELGIDVSQEIETGELGSVNPQTRPKSLTGTTKKLSTGYGDLFVTINEVDEGQPFEVFANIGKSGAYTESFTESTARLISLCLRCGIDPEDVIEQIEGIRSPKVSWDRGDQVYSVPDGIALAMRRYMDEKSETFESEATSIEEKEDSTGSKSSREVIDAGENPECPDCGSLSLYYSEGCKTCEECGWSEC